LVICQQLHVSLAVSVKITKNIVLVESAFLWVGQVQDALLFVVVTSISKLFFQFFVAQSHVLLGNGAITLFYQTVFVSLASHLPIPFR